jgi:hypothetical protein
VTVAPAKGGAYKVTATTTPDDPAYANATFHNAEGSAIWTRKFAARDADTMRQTSTTP